MTLHGCCLRKFSIQLKTPDAEDERYPARPAAPEKLAGRGMKETFYEERFRKSLPVTIYTVW
jgi:hypothetical protein